MQIRGIVHLMAVDFNKYTRLAAEAMKMHAQKLLFIYSTVTLCVKFPCWSTSQPRRTAMWKARQKPRMIPNGPAETSVGICAANDYSGHLAV